MTRPKSRRSLVVAIAAAPLLLALVGTAISLPAGPASAQGGTCTTYNQYFDGYQHNNTTGYGARMNTRHVSPVVCGAAGTSSVWSMITDGTGTDFAQSGELMNAAWSTTTVYYFTECGLCDNTDGSIQTSAPVNKGAVGQQSNSSYNDEYSSWFTPSTGVTTQQIAPANDPTLTSNLNTYSVMLFTPSEYDFYGEVHYPESQMPGITSNHDVLSSIQGLSSPGGSWVTQTPAMMQPIYDTFPYGGYTSYGSNGSFGIWDTRD